MYHFKFRLRQINRQVELIPTPDFKKNYHLTHVSRNSFRHQTNPKQVFTHVFGRFLFLKKSAKFSNFFLSIKGHVYVFLKTFDTIAINMSPDTQII